MTRNGQANSGRRGSAAGCGKRSAVALKLFAYLLLPLAVLAFARPAAAQDASWGDKDKKTAKPKDGKVVQDPPKKATPKLTPEQEAAAKARADAAEAERAARKAAAEKAAAEQAEKTAQARAAAKAAAEAAAAERAEKFAAALAARKAAAEEAAAAVAARIAAKKAARQPAPFPAADAAGCADATTGCGEPAPPQGDLLATFRQLLAPLGSWVTDPAYGELWVPSAAVVGDDFAPYRTNGHWVVTDRDQWAWASDFDWGKVPFHYGRWVWRTPSADTAASVLPHRGWAWAPATERAPAWVVWRVGEPGTDYVGWAPMAPAQGWVDGSGAARKPGVLPFWFVDSAHLFAPALAEHVVGELSLGKAILAASRVFTADGGSELAAANPGFERARIPAAAIPKARVTLDAVAPVVAATAAASDAAPPPEPAAAPEAPDAGRFATPPPPAAGPRHADDDDHDDADDDDDEDGDDDADEASSNDDDGGRFATPPPHDVRAAHDARARAWKNMRQRYGARWRARIVPRRELKCGYTLTQPSFWRCGY